MKHTHLSFAVLTALVLVACGGNGSGDSIADSPTDNITDNTTTPNTDTNTTDPDSTLVDPTQTHVVDNRNLLEEVSVGALQYVRREGSDYDRTHNPMQPAFGRITG